MQLLSFHQLSILNHITYKKCCHFWIHIVAHMANQNLSVYYLWPLLVNAKLYIKIWSEKFSLCWCTHVYFVKICILYLMGLNNHSHWRASKPIITATINTITTITTTDWLLSYLITLILEKVMTYFNVSYYPSILPGETEESHRETVIQLRFK